MAVGYYEQICTESSREESSFLVPLSCNFAIISLNKCLKKACAIRLICYYFQVKYLDICFNRGALEDTLSSCKGAGISFIIVSQRIEYFVKIALMRPYTQQPAPTYEVSVCSGQFPCSLTVVRSGT